jgi:hypothetical protein
MPRDWAGLLVDQWQAIRGHSCSRASRTPIRFQTAFGANLSGVLRRAFSCQAPILPPFPVPKYPCAPQARLWPPLAVLAKKICVLCQSSQIGPSIRGEGIPGSEYSTGRAKMNFVPSSKNGLAFLAPCLAAGGRREECSVSLGRHPGAEGGCA